MLDVAFQNMHEYMKCFARHPIFLSFLLQKLQANLRNDADLPTKINRKNSSPKETKGMIGLSHLSCPCYSFHKQTCGVPPSTKGSKPFHNHADSYADQ